MTVLAPTMWECDVMELLRQHVPLTLLVDLMDPTGPHSREIATSESATPVAGPGPVASRSSVSAPGPRPPRRP